MHLQTHCFVAHPPRAQGAVLAAPCGAPLCVAVASGGGELAAELAPGLQLEVAGSWRGPVGFMPCRTARACLGRA